MDAGVEEINGLDGIRPVREWYGYAFGLPDRHPTTSVVVRFDAHAWWPVLGGWSDRVARGGLRTG